MRFRTCLLTALLALGAAGCQATPDDIDAQSATTGDSQMVYELRTYTAHEGKLPDLERRFRDHTTRIFTRYGMDNIGYWIPDDERAHNTLIYIISHADRETATSNWASFRADPEWVEARAASEENGPLVQSVESVFLHPTDYSPLK